MIELKTAVTLQQTPILKDISLVFRQVVKLVF